MGKKNLYQNFFSLLLPGHCVDSIKQIKKICPVHFNNKETIITCLLSRSHTWGRDRLSRPNIHQQITKERVGSWLWRRSSSSSSSWSSYWLGNWGCFLSLSSCMEGKQMSTACNAKIIILANTVNACYLKHAEQTKQKLFKNRSLSQ